MLQWLCGLPQLITTKARMMRAAAAMAHGTNSPLIGYVSNTVTLLLLCIALLCDNYTSIVVSN